MRIRANNLAKIAVISVSVCLVATLLAPPPTTHAAAPGGGGWTANATAFRGQNGKRFSYSCPAAGSFGSVYGTDTYTDDSSVCTAAVHAGVLNPSTGGTVTIEIRPGAAAYTGSLRHGVSSSSYGSWPGSFVVVGSATGLTTVVQVGGSGWTANATAFRGDNGARFSYTCPAGGPIGSVYGTGTYTDDSSVCTAAVHAGVISVSSGGKVIIEIRPGASAYTGSTRHGVTSASYGAWSGSYVIIPPPPPASSSNGGGTQAGMVVLKFLTATVSPGGQQAALITAAPKASIVIVIDYPDGSQAVVGPKQAGADGEMVFTWNIPKNQKGSVFVAVISATRVAQGSFKV